MNNRCLLISKILLLIFSFSFLLVLSGCSFNIDNPMQNIPLERNIRSDDITWGKASQGASSVTLNFTANAKIKTVTIKVTFLNKKDEIVTTNTKILTDLQKDQAYSQLFGIDFLLMLSVNSYTYQIVSGTVDLT